MADKKKKQQEAVETANGTFGELKAMVTDYAKQQTTEPLKNLGSWTVFGLVGAVMFIIGAFLSWWRLELFAVHVCVRDPDDLRRLVLHGRRQDPRLDERR